MSLRVALLGIYHESNTFLEEPTTLHDFENGHWLFGQDIIKEYRNAHHEIAGMLEVMERQDIEVVPIMYAEATPGGKIASRTYSQLLKSMISALDKNLPVDGCLVVPHGAAVSEKYLDMDGHWLSMLREKLGPLIPIVGTIDPHANVSETMATSTDCLVAYKTNPHLDQRAVGKEAATIMADFLKGRRKPVQKLFQLPMVISIEQQYTGRDPCLSLYNYARNLNKVKGVLSLSIVLGFPYADVMEMGTSIIVVTDNDSKLAIEIGNKIKENILNDKERFVGKKIKISEVLPILSESSKPVLMLDMGDNVGGGAPGNSTFLLEELERFGSQKFFICLYDPEAVRQVTPYEPGYTFTVKLTNDVPGDLLLSVILLYKGSGKFRETDPRHGGQVNYDMGDIAVVQTQKGNVIMLISLRVPPFSLQQLLSFNIDPKAFDVIIAKGVNAPIAAYETVCRTIIQVDTPGVTKADMTLFSYSNRRIPLYPFEK